jgi:hypothetical protein
MEPSAQQDSADLAIRGIAYPIRGSTKIAFGETVPRQPDHSTRLQPLQCFVPGE